MNNLFNDLLGSDSQENEYIGETDDKHIMLVEVNRGNLIYLADGMSKDLEYMVSILERLAQFRLLKIDIADDVDMETMRRNSKLLNEKFRHLIEK